MNNFRLNSRAKLILKLFLSASLILVIFKHVDITKLMQLLLKANPWYLLGVIVIFYLDRGVMAYKWGILLRIAGAQVPFWVLLKTYSVAPIFATVLPGTVSGDLFRIFNLSRYGVGSQTVFVSIMVERLLSLLSLFALAFISIGSAVYWAHDTGIATALFAGVSNLVIIVCLVVAVLALLIFFFRASIKVPERIQGNWLSQKALELYALGRQYWESPGAVTTVLGWTLLEQTVPIIVHALLIHALHLPVTLWAIFMVVPVIVFLARLPILLDTLGIAEGIYIILFGLVGLSASEAFLLAMSSRLIPSLSLLPWGIYYILKERHSIPPEWRTSAVQVLRRSNSTESR